MKPFCILLCMILLLSGCENKLTESTSQNSSSMAETKNINNEVLNEFGLSYHQIEEKYGTPTDTGYWRGGYFYYFKNGKGCYFFGTTNESLPTEADLCQFITLAVSDFFLDMDKEYTFEEIQSKYSFRFVESGESFDEMDSFESVFLFKDYEIVFVTNSPEKVMSDDWLYIHKIV